MLNIPVVLTHSMILWALHRSCHFAVSYSLVFRLCFIPTIKNTPPSATPNHPPVSLLLMGGLMTGGWSVQSQPDACPRLPIRPQAYKKADFVLGAGKAAREDGDGASGSIIIVFVQITWRHFKMQLSDNKYSTFLGVAWCHQIEATARASVPQRCLEQGFACAVICRKPLRGRTLHGRQSGTIGRNLLQKRQLWLVRQIIQIFAVQCGQEHLRAER